jgi:enterochelin esterase-like enzyme
VSRRRLLGLGAVGGGLVAAAAAGVESGLLPGRSRVYAELGLNGSPGRLPDGPGAVLVSGSFASAARRTEVGWSVAYPSGAVAGDALPVVVALHGRFDDHTALFGDHLGLDRFLAADPGLRFAVAAVDGGDTYWHPRSSGEDAGAMVLDEFLPLLASRGLLTDRLGFYGYSMGGYGALRLAGVLGRDRVAAVVAVSAALWTSAGATAPGAFDDADDFRTHSVMHQQDRLAGVPVRLDCGRGDSFCAAVTRYRSGFPSDAAPAGGVQRGGHDVGYWRRLAPVELRFLASHLT